MRTKVVNNTKIAALSIDLDHESDYAMVYGVQNFHPIKEYMYEESIPRILDLLDEFAIKATFFIVGRDLNFADRVITLKKILDKGHELANHSYSHQHNFHLLSEEQKRQEIECAHTAVEKVLGYQMVGFRAPGYNIDTDSIKLLAKKGYLYDSSIHPTVLHPLLRIALFLKTRRCASLNSMGHWSVISAPTTPYHCLLQNVRKKDQLSPFIEIPISVLPYLRLPFFGTMDLMLGHCYFSIMFPLLQQLPIVNYEVHGIDLIDTPKGNLAWFGKHPGMRKHATERTAIYRYILKHLSSEYMFIPLKKIAENLRQA